MPLIIQNNTSCTINVHHFEACNQPHPRQHPRQHPSQHPSKLVPVKQRLGQRQASPPPKKKELTAKQIKKNKYRNNCKKMKRYAKRMMNEAEKKDSGAQVVSHPKNAAEAHMNKFQRRLRNEDEEEEMK